MRRTWLGVVFAVTVAAAVSGVQDGSARAQQTPPAEPPATASDASSITETVASIESASPESAATDAQEQSADAQAAEGPAPCSTLASGRLAGVLSAVPRYGSSYVLVIPERLAETVPNATAPAVRTLHVGVTSGSAAPEVARALGMSNVEERPFHEGAPVELLQDVRDGKLDAAIIWAPLAGFGILNLGLDGLVSVYTVDKPHPAPAVLHAAASDDPCVAAIAEELDVNGVLPAELLVSVEIRDLLGEQPPAFDLAQARDGGARFNETCARCHGADAVADPHGLAPVDLRLSIRRFSYAGFHYIVLNGRPLKSMPGFRGTVTNEQISLIYQYLKARSNNALPASPSPTPAGESTEAQE